VGIEHERRAAHRVVLTHGFHESGFDRKLKVRIDRELKVLAVVGIETDLVGLREERPSERVPAQRDLAALGPQTFVEGPFDALHALAVDRDETEGVRGERALRVLATVLAEGTHPRQRAQIEPTKALERALVELAREPRELASRVIADAVPQAAGLGAQHRRGGLRHRVGILDETGIHENRNRVRRDGELAPVTIADRATTADEIDFL